jgi:sugar lactone lactonase YvrE
MSSRWTLRRNVSMISTISTIAWIGALLIAADRPGRPAETAAPPPRTTVPFGRVEVIAGGGDYGDGGKAVDALFNGVGGLAVDPQGNAYLSDSAGNRVRRIDGRTGIVTTVAGTGLLFGAPSKLAVERPLEGPAPLSIDAEGRFLYVGEIVGRRVQRIDLVQGTIEDLGGPAGGFGKPGGLAWTPAGLLVADAPRGQVWKRGLDGAWTGILPQEKRARGGVRAVAQDGRGRIYMVEYFTHRVLRWDTATGQSETVAGTGESGRVADGAQAAHSPLRTPDSVLLDRAGNLLVSDMGNKRVCRVDAETGRMTTLYESGPQGSPQRWTPGPMALDSEGNLWVGDIYRNRVLRFAPGATEPAVVAGDGDIKDDGPALAARLAHPGSVASDAQGNVYVSDTLHHRVRVIDAATGRIRTVAGTGIPGYNGDDIPAREAWLGYPAELQIDTQGALYISDYYNNRVRRVDPRTGRIATLAGNGEAGEDGDGRLANQAPLLNPHALLLEGDRSMIVASAVSSRLRQIDLASGRVFSVPLGPGVSENLVFHGLARWNGGLVLALPRPGAIEMLKDGKLSELVGHPAVEFPQDVAVSPEGELYVCETGRNRVVKWAGGKLEVVVENLGRPRAISFDPKGDLLIADTFHNRVLRVRLGLAKGSGEVVAQGSSRSGGEPRPASSR